MNEESQRTRQILLKPGDLAELKFIEEHEDDLTEIIVESSEYYLSVWKKMFGSKSIKLNWVAAAFSYPWLAFRKMYDYVVVFFVVANGAFVITLSYLRTLFAPEIINIILGIVMVSFKVVFGLFANRIYYQRAKKIILRGKELYSDKDEYTDYLRKRGGNSGLATIIFTALNFGLNFLITRFFSLD